MITIKKSDIGGEIISILTKGMYSDPKDALREYVQNGVDAGAKNIDIKIRQNNIIVQDDGSGMDYDIMRKAIRLGVSDKNPKNQVGFMGIGIYSSFHICKQLIIYSRVKGQGPNKISFDFKKMRAELDIQREARFRKELKEEELVALQKLMENNIYIEKLNTEDFVKTGTRVELVGLESDFFKSLSKFREVADYLERVTPLPFNPKFKYGHLIESRIKEFCEKNNAKFEMVNIKLQVNDDIENLYKPYLDSDFESESLSPEFLEIKNEKELFGIAWWCLNKEKTAIKNEDVRGFLLKKQGFRIGKREDLLEYFGRPVFFNRTIGEIIITNSRLLPNASRSTFEPSPLRISLYSALMYFATYFNEFANTYQENTKANDELNNAIDFVKVTNAQLDMYKDNQEKLLELLFQLKEIDKDLLRRDKASRFKKIKRENDYKIVTDKIAALANEIRTSINLKKKTVKRKTESQIANANQNLPKKQSVTKESEYRDLLDLLTSLGYELDDDIQRVFQLLDEHYIQPSKSKKEYQTKLRKLRQDIEELFEE